MNTSVSDHFVSIASLSGITRAVAAEVRTVGRRIRYAATWYVLYRELVALYYCSYRLDD